MRLSQQERWHVPFYKPELGEIPSQIKCKLSRKVMFTLLNTRLLWMSLETGAPTCLAPCTSTNADTSKDAEAEAVAPWKTPWFTNTFCTREGFGIHVIHFMVQLLNPVVLPLVTLCDDWSCPWKISKFIHLYMSTLFSLWKSPSIMSVRYTSCPRIIRTFLQAAVDTSSSHLFHVWRRLKQE